MGGDRPNNAILVVECGASVDVARLERALARLVPLAPLLASRLERPWPWGRLRWRAVDAVLPVSARRLAAGESIDAVVDGVLNEAVDPRRMPPLRWHVVERADGGGAWVLLAWVHPLMGPRGAEARF